MPEPIIDLTDTDRTVLAHVIAALSAVGLDAWDSVDPIVPARAMGAADELRGVLGRLGPGSARIPDTADAVSDTLTAALTDLQHLRPDVLNVVAVREAESLVQASLAAI